jgi:hypothetical protein
MVRAAGGYFAFTPFPLAAGSVWYAIHRSSLAQSAGRSVAGVAWILVAVLAVGGVGRSLGDGSPAARAA